MTKPATTKMTIGSAFGEIVWLMNQSNRHRNHFFIGDLDWLILPAITTGQFRIFRADDNPFAVALWAYVSAAVAQRLSQGLTKLKPDDWRSGEQAWLMDIIAPFGHTQTVLTELQQTSLADVNFKMLHIDSDGKQKVVEYSHSNTNTH